MSLPRMRGRAQTSAWLGFPRSSKRLGVCDESESVPARLHFLRLGGGMSAQRNGGRHRRQLVLSRWTSFLAPRPRTRASRGNVDEGGLVAPLLHLPGAVGGSGGRAEDLYAAAGREHGRACRRRAANDGRPGASADLASLHGSSQPAAPLTTVAPG